jgi:hypothetical protein
MRTVIKPGRSRTFNGLKIINPDKRRPVSLIIEPAKRIVEHKDEPRTIDTRDESDVE